MTVSLKNHESSEMGSVSPIIFTMLHPNRVLGLENGDSCPTRAILPTTPPHPTRTRASRTITQATGEWANGCLGGYARAAGIQFGEVGTCAECVVDNLTGWTSRACADGRRLTFRDQRWCWRRSIRCLRPFRGRSGASRKRTATRKRAGPDPPDAYTPLDTGVVRRL